MMNDKNIDSVKISTYLSSYIVAGVLFGIIFALSMTLFNFVAYQSSSIIMNLVFTAALISAFIITGITAVRCAKANKIKNPDIFTPPRDTVFYFKRIAFFVIMIVLMSLAVSLIGMFVNALWLGIVKKITAHAFFSEFLLKLPMFIVYLVFIYKMLVRYGFMDSQRKIFNPDLKIITFIIAFIIMLPGLAHSNFFYVSSLNDGMINVQTVLSPSVGTYTIESDGYVVPNENFGAFNVIMIAVTVLVTFAVQACVFAFAYKRGKKIFMKQHIRETDEYEMNENI